MRLASHNGRYGTFFQNFYIEQERKVYRDNNGDNLPYLPCVFGFRLR
jgi:hypothetical protein